MGIVQCTYCSQMHHCCRTLCQSHYTKKKHETKIGVKIWEMAIRGVDSILYTPEKSCTMQEQALTRTNTNFAFWTLDRNNFAEVLKMVIINILYSKSSL